MDNGRLTPFALPDRLRAEQVAREDLVMFVNACFSCTGQREFYNDARGQGRRTPPLVSIIDTFLEE